MLTALEEALEAEEALEEALALDAHEYTEPSSEAHDSELGVLVRGLGPRCF